MMVYFRLRVASSPMIRANRGSAANSAFTTGAAAL